MLPCSLYFPALSRSFLWHAFCDPSFPSLFSLSHSLCVSLSLSRLSRVSLSLSCLRLFPSHVSFCVGCPDSFSVRLIFASRPPFRVACAVEVACSLPLHCNCNLFRRTLTHAIDSFSSIKQPWPGMNDCDKSLLSPLLNCARPRQSESKQIDLIITTAAWTGPTNTGNCNV